MHIAISSDQKLIYYNLAETDRSTDSEANEREAFFEIWPVTNTTIIIIIMKMGRKQQGICPRAPVEGTPEGVRYFLRYYTKSKIK